MNVTAVILRVSGRRLLLSASRSRPAAAAAGRAAARAAWTRSRTLSSSSSSSSRGVEEELLQQLQQQRRLSLEEVLQATQRLLQRQHTSFAHPGASSSSSRSRSSSSRSRSSSSSTVLPDEFVAFISAAAAAAAEQQQRLLLLQDIRFQQLLQQLRARLVGFSVPQLFRLCVALARLQHCPHEVLSRILYLLGGPPNPTEGPREGLPLKQLSPRQLAQLPVLLAAATGSCDPAVPRCSSRPSEFQQQQHEQDKDSVRGFLAVYGQHVLALLQQQQQALNESASSGGVAGAAAVGEAAAAATAATTAAAAAHFTAEDLCMLLVGSSSLRYRQPPVVNAAAAALQLLLALQFGGPTAPEQRQQQQQQQQGEEIQQQQLMLLPLSSVLLSLGTLGADNGSAIVEVSHQLTRIAPLLSVSKLADCLLALASLQGNPSASLSLALLSVVESQLVERASSCSKADAVTAAWAAVALQLHRGDPALVQQLLRQVQLLQHEEVYTAEEEWRELPVRLRQVSLELCLDPRARRLRQLLQQEGLGDFVAFPDSLSAEATELPEEEETGFEEEIEQFLQRADVRNRLLLTVDARLQQQQAQQEQQQQEQQQAQQEQLQQEQQQQQEQQVVLEGEEADRDSFERIAASVELKHFPSLRTYRLLSLFRWPAAAAAAAPAAAARAMSATEGTSIAAAVHEAEQRGGDFSTRTLGIVCDTVSFPGFEVPAEVYVQLKYRHLLHAGHALIAVRLNEWRAASDDEARLGVLVSSLQLPHRA
ncbi:hypothetical protein Esti_002887 [Eimeria stiedai]